MQPKTRKQTLFVPAAFILLFALVVGSAAILSPSAMAQSRPKVTEETERTRSREQSPKDTRQEPAPAGRMTTDVVPKQETPEIVSAAQNRAWTSSGSTGTVDEDSAAIAQLKNFTVTFLPLAAGSINVRYNITPTTGISSFCPATTSTVKVRFRNSDNAGTTARVSFEIHATNVASGGNNIIYSFDSNGKGSGLSFTTFTDSAAAIDFDFSTKVYWIEATIFRNDLNQLADLGAIQIWESAGTFCP